MKYLSLNTLDTSQYPYPDPLNHISITIRGSKNLFDIFFSYSEIESSFDINLPNQIDFTWINTANGKERYISYPTIKKVLFQLIDKNVLAEQYLAWVDWMLFSSNKPLPFFQRAYSIAPTDNTSSADGTSDIDDASSVSSFHSTQANEYLITALQHKVDQLDHELELKNKDIIILTRDIQIRDKDIELLQLKLSISPQSHWI